MKKEKLKEEKVPSKFKAWKKKMKETPKGRAYLKLIYWAIFFAILFIFLVVTTMITSDYNAPTSYEDGTKEEPEIPSETEFNPEVILDMQTNLLNGTYDYKYYIENSSGSYLFDGTKYNNYEEGYKNYTNESGNGVIKYYKDSTGIYQVNGEEKVLSDAVYQNIDTNYLNLRYVFDIINQLELKEDTGNYGYPVYYGVDPYYRYTINISKDETKITDISIVSLDETVSYLLSFSNLEEAHNE